MYSLKSIIETFDELWCQYEESYISELIVIEKDARRFIYDLTESRDDQALFIEAIGKLNSVANTQG